MKETSAKKKISRRPTKQVLFGYDPFLEAKDSSIAISQFSIKYDKIVNDYSDYDILIEGHTDNVPITTTFLKDNWDLSAMRATSIARFMQTDLSVDPARITAGARSEYVPKASNDTTVGRSTNRRTEIIVLPKLDEFIKLMEKAPSAQ